MLLTQCEWFQGIAVGKMPFEITVELRTNEEVLIEQGSLIDRELLAELVRDIGRLPSTWPDDPLATKVALKMFEGISKHTSAEVRVVVRRHLSDTTASAGAW